MKAFLPFLAFPPFGPFADGPGAPLPPFAYGPRAPGVPRKPRRTVSQKIIVSCTLCVSADPDNSGIFRRPPAA